MKTITSDGVENNKKPYSKKHADNRITNISELKGRTNLTKKIYEVMQMPYLSERHDAIMALITKEREEALKPFYEAFNNKGSHPDYHDEQVKYLKTHWPILYKLLSELKKERD